MAGDDNHCTCLTARASRAWMSLASESISRAEEGSSMRMICVFTKESPGQGDALALTTGKV